MRIRMVVGAVALAVVCCAGCARTLPRVRSEYLDQRITAIPPSAAPVFSWHAEKKGLKTYWRDQEVFVDVRGYVPLEGAESREGIWLVTGRSGEGKPVPFIGIQRRFTSPQGAEMAVIVPPLDLDRVPDGLYLFLIPNISVTLGKVTSIAPVVVLTEIRNHVFMPFQVPMPLVPERPSPLTPAPPPEPGVPEGTPIPIG